MTELIVAMDEGYGLGFKGRIPWDCKEELELFKQNTMNKTLVMGRKTVETLPKLFGRKIICISRNHILDVSKWKNNVEIMNQIGNLKSYRDVVIAGGSQIYENVLTKSSMVSKIHLSIVKGKYKCDTFFQLEWLKDFVISDKQDYKDFKYFTLERTDNGEQQYLSLLRTILDKGELRHSRSGDTISSFKNDMTFDLRNGFPLLTTKKMFFRGILEEFLFFLRGDTDSTILSKNNVKIWEKNTIKENITKLNLPYAEGVLGPMYGYQWRFFNAPYRLNSSGRPIPPKGGVDQLANVINLIKNDPYSRRIIMTTYNPAQADMGVLYPCHSIVVQFYVQKDFLDMFCYNRSQDVFLGVPFNIASSSLLLIVVAKLTNKVPRFVHISMGDSHIYSNHVEQVHTQLERIPYVFPTLKVTNLNSLKDIPSLATNDFILENYLSHPKIKAEMSE